jgi:hypothetical protein
MERKREEMVKDMVKGTSQSPVSARKHLKARRSGAGWKGFQLVDASYEASMA